MTDDLLLTRHDEWPAVEAGLVDHGLEAANRAAAPLGEVQALSCFARRPDGTVVGGALGRRWGRCCELQQLWVLPSERRQGLGARLVREFEALALERGCSRSFLETFSFQAPRLYRALGYREAHRNDGFPHGILKHLMVRDLSGEVAAKPRFADQTLHVRPLATDDVTIATQLRLALLQETGAAQDDGDALQALRPATEAFFRRSLSAADWQTWVALASDTATPVAIGSLAMWLRPPYPGNPAGMDAYLLNMYTAPAHRGRGAARGIAQAALAWARQRGVPKLILHATPAGRALYETLGFTGSMAYMELELNQAP